MRVNDGAMGNQEGGEGATATGGGGSQGGEEDEGNVAGAPSSVGLGSFKTFLYCNGIREAGKDVSILSGLHDLDEIKKWDQSRNWCPYYLIGRAVNHKVIVGRDDDSRDGSR